MTKVIKKDGTVEPFDMEKIFEAINKASQRANCNIRRGDHELLESYITFECETKGKDIPTSEMHSIVIKALYACDYKAIGDAYKEFRDYKNTYAKAFEKVKDDADTVLLLGDRENANFDSSLISTKGSLIKGYLTKELYKQFYLNKEELQATKEGTIYIHDLRDMIFNSINCCLFDMGNVLKDGFSMSNVDYTEPTSVLSALQVIGDITLVATAQQFGGFTIPSIDKTLLPYARKTYNNAFKKYFDTCNLEHDEADSMARGDLKRELEQGFQSLELKLNTVPCSRGDFAFTTLTFGEWSNDLPDLDKEILQMVCETILEIRMKGHGPKGKQVVFPKLVYLYDWEQHSGAEHAEVFDKAVECSSKCMYPDYLAINSDYGAVSETYRASNKKCVTHPMGCRAYLTPWYDLETNEYVSVGRCNIGAVSLNLPLIYKKDPEKFYENLTENLELIRKFFQKRYEAVAETKACTNPMAFCQGGFYKGNLNPDDKIGDLTQYMTASFGVTALSEFVELHGLKLNSALGRDLAIKVVDFINKKIKGFKEEDGHLYALYGTPAESLCGTQMQQYHDYCKAHGVKDEFEGRNYFTNSFHIHVAEDISPVEKQTWEFPLFHKVQGGHIQYIRIDNPENLKAVKALIIRGMYNGFYQGVNFDAAVCEDCGEHSTNVGKHCPHCGSDNISVISRVCGYLGYSNVNGHSRMNDAKMAEIKDRVSM